MFVSHSSSTFFCSGLCKAVINMSRFMLPFFFFFFSFLKIPVVVLPQFEPC